jgi:hypothetical protein
LILARCRSASSRLSRASDMYRLPSADRPLPSAPRRHDAKIRSSHGRPSPSQNQTPLRAADATVVTVCCSRASRSCRSRCDFSPLRDRAGPRSEELLQTVLGEGTKPLARRGGQHHRPPLEAFQPREPVLTDPRISVRFCLNRTEQNV